MEKGGLEKTVRTPGCRGSFRLLIAMASFSILCLLSAARPAYAEVPVKFTYQGNLRQAGFLVTGTRSMRFRIYAASDSAVALWVSPAPVNVHVSTGVFRVTIEPVLPAVANWETGSLWLEPEINGVRMSPREEITSTPYAVNSLLLGGKRYVTAADETVIPHPHTPGDLWMDTATNTLKFWNGGDWIDTIMGALPGPHANTHDVGGGDPILNLGAHNVSGAITFDSVGELRVGGAVRAITISANAVVQNNLSVNGGATASSFTATGLGVRTNSLNLADNVVVSSESSGALGAGVRVSSNVYVVGFASATAFYGGFYGDGSHLTGISASFGDNLGNHAATKHLAMNGFDVAGAGYITASSVTVGGAAGVGASRLALADNVVVSSESSAALGGGVRVSSNVYIVGFASATAFYGDGSHLTGLTATGDNLGNHVATKHLAMSGFDVAGAGYVTASSESLSGQLVVGGSVTVGGASGVGASRLVLADNVIVSSESGAGFGGGVRVSSNVYIVGFASATAFHGSFYGDGSNLTGVKPTGDNLGNHIATMTVNMNGFDIIQAGSGMFFDSVSASTLTARGSDGVLAARLQLEHGVTISSEADAEVGGGVRVSSNVYIVGFASATAFYGGFYGDGSHLTGLGALGDNLGDHVATTTLNMNGQSIVNIASGTFNKNLTVYSTFTVVAPDTETASLWVSTSNATPHLYVSTGGNVGLGTASPNANLEVAGASGSGDYITIWKSGKKMAAWLRNK